MGKKNKNHHPKDIVILVMGPSGAGKSTFINHVLRKETMKVGRTQDSCTSEVIPAYIDPIPGFPELAGRRITIVDTPGFDDTFKTDTEILESMANWLEESYKDDGALLGGVIYVHDLSNDRFTGTAKRNLRMFREMCGDKALGKVVITTTKWKKLLIMSDARDETLAEERQKELKSTHWKEILDNGASVLSFRDNNDSAWAIVSNILSRLKQTELLHIYLQIQKELGDEGKMIPETAAGKELRKTLTQALEMQKQLTSMEKNSAAHGSEDAQQRLAEASEMIEQLLNQLRDLKIPFGLKVKRLFGLGHRRVDRASLKRV
ncbi:hypothetical protein GALMADRAFT_249713 [Galerina marginata CBS 339.88]|uniref:AIG1-type G domain-containing protein n=1 Tax=Galerina marginata (strain CBS 339.88) TaxID=685588 RepID=A0A067T729_GALM3|nr:hypothetical protein GALMADRAFT_249713 [Galerina marginata CBS 339.88]